MSYFSHAYRKSMLVKAVAAKDKATSAFIGGDFAMVDAATYKAYDPSATVATGDFLLVQGNYNQVDTIGGNALHGGYSESIKSKIIKPHFITKVWSADCRAACTTENIVVSIPDTCFPCGSHPQIRIDLKGDNIMRFLGRNNYFVADLTGCCAAANGATNFTGLEVANGWAAAINEDPTIGPFVTAVAAAATNKGTLTLTLECPDETYFDDCSFDTRDWYGTTPITMIASLIDDDGDACTEPCSTMTPANAANPSTTQVVVQPGETSGETILRDLILDGRYRQDGGHNQGNKDSARFRDIEGGDVLIAAVDRKALYKVYYVQHTVPRYNNPTGVFDNDQYVVSVAVLCSDTSTIGVLDTIFTAIADSGGVESSLTPLGTIKAASGKK